MEVVHSCGKDLDMVIICETRLRGSESFKWIGVRGVGSSYVVVAGGYLKKNVRISMRDE